MGPARPAIVRPQQLTIVLVAVALAEQEFEVDPLRSFALKQVVGADVAEEIAGTGRGRDLDVPRLHAAQRQAARERILAVIQEYRAP